jgi:hypothetical protein
MQGSIVQSLVLFLRIPVMVPSAPTPFPERIRNEFNRNDETVRRELTNMADENRIRLAGWDGRQVRPLTEWRNRDEFVENAPEGFPVRVELVE